MKRAMNRLLLLALSKRSSYFSSVHDYLIQYQVLFNTRYYLIPDTI